MIVTKWSILYQSKKNGTLIFVRTFSNNSLRQKVNSVENVIISKKEKQFIIISPNSNHFFWRRNFGRKYFMYFQVLSFRKQKKCRKLMLLFIYYVCSHISCSVISRYPPFLPDFVPEATYFTTKVKTMH